MIDQPSGRQGGHAWRKIKGEIRELIRQGICTRQDRVGKKNGIDRGLMMRESLDDVQTIFYTTDRQNKITAFLLARWDMPGKEMETMIVCSVPDKGSGKPIVMESLKEARHRGMEVARLHALRRVLTYYPKFGYKRMESEEQGSNSNGWLFEKNLSNTVNWMPHKPVEKKLRAKTPPPLVYSPEPPPFVYSPGPSLVYPLLPMSPSPSIHIVSPSPSIHIVSPSPSIQVSPSPSIQVSPSPSIQVSPSPSIQVSPSPSIHIVSPSQSPKKPRAKKPRNPSAKKRKKKTAAKDDEPTMSYAEYMKLMETAKSESKVRGKYFQGPT
jgi:hypothetical protein